MTSAASYSQDSEAKCGEWPAILLDSGCIEEGIEGGLEEDIEGGIVEDIEGSVVEHGGASCRSVRRRQDGAATTGAYSLGLCFRLRSHSDSSLAMFLRCYSPPSATTIAYIRLRRP